MKDNRRSRITAARRVVNCFQKLLSSWWRTTQIDCIHINHQLWIAFKNYYLRDEGQLFFLHSRFQEGCELLSKIIIFVMKDNYNEEKSTVNIVVNCFQKLLSSWWRTTNLEIAQLIEELWIAFKNYYLRDEGQQLVLKYTNEISCELLSKIIIFVMKDNYYSK